MPEHEAYNVFHQEILTLVSEHSFGISEADLLNTLKSQSGRNVNHTKIRIEALQAKRYLSHKNGSYNITPQGYVYLDELNFLQVQLVEARDQHKASLDTSNKANELSNEANRIAKDAGHSAHTANIMSAIALVLSLAAIIVELVK